MAKDKCVSVREFLGRLWKSEKFDEATVYNDGDLLVVQIGKKKMFAFELAGRILSQDEIIDIDSEFTDEDWDGCVKHTIPASMLDIPRDEPMFARGGSLLNH